MVAPLPTVSAGFHDQRKARWNDRQILPRSRP